MKPVIFTIPTCQLTKFEDVKNLTKIDGGKTTFVERDPLLSGLRGVRECLEAYKKYSGFPVYAEETLAKLDTLIKTLEEK